MPDNLLNKRTTGVNPTWCPGCGNFGILGAIKASFDQLKIEPQQAVVVYDIGCSGNMADFVYSYGFHSLHGRALPVGAGIKLSNHSLKVLNIIGDGGCFGEGVGHLVGIAKGNHDMTVLTHDNFLYSLTTGQKSPTTPKGVKTPSTPEGSLDEPVNPLGLAIINQATFVARGFAGDIPHLTQLLTAALSHRGFALLDVLQPCPTYNQDRPYNWYREHIYKLEETDYQPTDRLKEIAKTMEEEKLPIGIFFKESKPTYHQQINSLKTATLISQSKGTVDLTSALSQLR